MQKKEYMLRAIELAKQGVGWTSPNPLVGGYCERWTYHWGRIS